MSTAPTTSPSPPPRFIDSPWYWVYLFSTAGLIALILAGPKFASRQSQIERKAQGRQRAIQNLQGEVPTTPLSTSENTHIHLRPLYYVLGALLVVAWTQLIRKKLRDRRTLLPPKTSSADGSPSNLPSQSAHERTF